MELITFYPVVLAVTDLDAIALFLRYLYVAIHDN